MKPIILASLLVAILVAHWVATAPAQEPSSLSGNWTVSLEIGPSQLPFGLELARDGSEWTAHLVNGPEQIPVPHVSFSDDRLVLDIVHYDSKLTLSADRDNGQFVGTWKKRRGKDNWAVVPATMARRSHMNWQDPAEFIGRWAVRFDGEPDPAVAIFSQDRETNRVDGTFLTTTGDYRYLSGGVTDGQLTLSCFDGAHAFLFQIKSSEEGKIGGTFYSGNWWNTQFTGQRDEHASLPDAFQQTVWTDKVELADLAFPDLNGDLYSLDDSRFAGQCRIIEIFGSWCPNCHDAGVYLSELDEKYGDQGLSILGLAFELTGEFERDAQQVREFMKRNETHYPVLIAGTSDKALASEILPVLDKVRSYPTIIFLDASGNVKAIYTGFAGPATGDAHDKLRRQFEKIIRETLGITR